MEKAPIGAMVSDFHIDKNNTETVKQLFEETFEICKARGITDLFIVGDAFKSRVAQPLHILLAFQWIIQRARIYGINIFAIAGNHDKTDLEAEESYLNLYEQHPNFNLYPFETTLNYTDVHVHLLGYFKENGSYLERLELLKERVKNYPNQKHVLLTHIGVNSTLDNEGLVVEGALDAGCFTCFDLVVIGHFHNASKFENILYMGSMLQANFGEDDNKGVRILYNDLSVEFLNLNFKKFIKHYIDVTDKEALKKFEDLYAGSEDHVRLILTGEETKVKAYNRERLAEKGIDVKLEPDNVTEAIKQAKNGVVIQFTTGTILEAFKIFADEKKIDKKETGLEYLNKLFNK